MAKKRKTHSLKSLRKMLENTGKHFSGNHQEWQSIYRSVRLARQRLMDEQEGARLLKLEANDFLSHCLNVIRAEHSYKRLYHLISLQDTGGDA